MLVSNLGLTRFNKCEDTGAAQNGDTWGSGRHKMAFALSTRGSGWKSADPRLARIEERMHVSTAN